MKSVEADVIIVGSGVAGGLLADRLARAGIGVAVLEAGSRVDRGKALQRYVNAPIKTPESPYPTAPEADFPVAADAGHWYRQSGPDNFKSTYLKAVGGTTWHWLGTCLRFLPEDFRLQSLYGRGVDWPIDYHTLEPYYSLAEWELGVAGDSSENLGSPRSMRLPLPPIAPSHLDTVFKKALKGTAYDVQATPQARNSTAHDGRPACCGSASCIPLCPVQAKYDATVHLEKAQRLGVALHERATATLLETGANGRIDGVRFRRPDRSEGIARGRLYVLAAHAIETPRLLLNSRSEHTPTGVANRSDQVGRNLMDHPIQLSWALAGEPVWPYRGPLSTAGIENLRGGAARSKRASLRIQIGNGGWTWATGGALALARTLAESGLRGEALRKASRDQASRHVELASLTEQLPNAENRIELDTLDQDHYGVPLPRLHYAVGDYANNGLATARDIHDRIFAKLGSTQTHHHPEFQGAGHIIGTCRMGDDPTHSVVDSALRCHDHHNLHILGSSVFPTSGTANPTLTIAALALRLADSIKATLAQGIATPSS